jgi:hypothetical protein
VLFIARQISFAAVLAMVVVPVVDAAQTSGGRGKLIVTVSDPSGAIIPDATVTIVGLEADGKAAAIPPAKTVANGSVTFEGLVPGRYSITAEFAGFDQGVLRDVRVNRGDNKHAVVLPLKNMAESITVGGENQAADRASAHSA